MTKKTVAKSKKKPSAKASATAAVKTVLPQEETTNYISDIDFLYVHYVKRQKDYEIYVNPQIVKLFYDEYGIDLEYNEELKVFVGYTKGLPHNGSITFLEYKNLPISPAILKKAADIREELALIDEKIEALREEHAALRNRAIAIVLEHGIKTKKGRVAHKKILTGEWITAVRQLLPDIAMKTPNTLEIEDLIEKFPQHKKQLKRLTDATTQYYEIQDVNEENIFDVVRKINKHRTSEIKIQFKSNDAINEDEFPSCFSWDDIDLDAEKAEKILSELPFEVKLDLYNLPEEDDVSLQFHYKTDQKTKPDCAYCGGNYIKNTHKCEDCGLTAIRSVKKGK